MDKLLKILQDFTPYAVVIRLLLSALLGGAVGAGRERLGHPAGLRTHILVCLGASTATLVGLYSVCTLHLPGDPLRVGAQVISGIGFLGMGTILTRRDTQITGLTTAAGLWTTATIGISIGLGFYLGAIMVTILVILTMSWLSRVEKQKSNKNTIRKYYLELSSVDGLQLFVDQARHAKITIGIVHPRTGLVGNVGVECAVPESSELFWKSSGDQPGCGYVVFCVEE